MSTPSTNNNDVATDPATLIERIVTQVDEIISQSELSGKPLEVDPYRGELFELFAAAERAGLLAENAEQDLTADELCRRLAQGWGLQQAAQASVAQQTKLPAEQVQKMRSLWAVMRMWMEWTYAWSRWSEFHSASS